MSVHRTYGRPAAGWPGPWTWSGERWALLVVRELLLGPKRFTDLRAGLPGVGPDVLAQRLRDLEAAGVVARRRWPPPAASKVYELTAGAASSSRSCSPSAAGAAAPRLARRRAARSAGCGPGRGAGRHVPAAEPDAGSALASTSGSAASPGLGRRRRERGARVDAAPSVGWARRD